MLEIEETVSSLKRMITY